MIIYNYDEDSKEFLFTSRAQKNPKREGEYIFPKNSTTIIPPETEEHKVAVFNGEFWNISDDFRGLEQINLDTKEISNVKVIGALDNGYMLYSDYKNTPEYKRYISEQQIIEQKNEIVSQLKSLDEKRIRAVCEPSMKDGSQSWLEYYNEQVAELRQRLQEVNYDTSC